MINFSLFQLVIEIMPSKKTIRRKRAKAAKKRREQEQKLPRLPKVLCVLIRDYVQEFNNFPNRLDAVCEKWFKLHVQFRAINGYLEMLPPPTGFPGAGVVRKHLAKSVSSTRNNMQSADTVFTKVYTTQTIDKRDVLDDGLTMLETTFKDLDELHMDCRALALRAVDEHSFQDFRISME